MNGLKSNQFKIKDEVLLYLIQYYTREAGVRQLERVIGTCARKAVLAILKDKKKSIRKGEAYTEEEDKVIVYMYRHNYSASNIIKQ